MKSNMSVFTPERKSATSNIGIVLINHIGSTATNNLITRGDTVGDAAYMAETLGVTVVAVDRPGSGAKLPNPWVWRDLNRYATGKSVNLYSTTQSQIDELIATLGIKRTIITGRSAGGQGTIAFTKAGHYNEAVPIEPVGLAKTTVDEGADYYRNYIDREKIAFEDPQTKLILPPDSDQHGFSWLRRKLTIGRAVPSEKLLNSQLWASDITFSDSIAIAEDRIETHLSIVFASDSLVLPSNDPDTLQGTLRCVRAEAEGDPRCKADINAWSIENTMHGSFNNRELTGSILKESVERQADLLAS